MAGFNISQVLSVSPRMIWRGGVYPFQAAARTVRALHPQLKGIPRWRAIRQAMADPDTFHVPPEDTFVPLGATRQTDIDTATNSISMTAENGSLRVCVLANNLVQIRARTDGVFSEPFSYGVAKSAADWEAVSPTIDVHDDRVEISTGHLNIVLDRQTNHMAIQDEAGRTLLTSTTGPAYHPEQSQIRWQAEMASDAAFYGLGEKASALNHAGRKFDLWNIDPIGYERGKEPIYMSIPFLISLSEGQGLGLFFDNSYRATLDVGREHPGRVSYAAAGGEFRLYVMVGTPAEIMARYTGLTGTMKLPPLWGLGFHQSRWSYYPQERALEIAREFRQRSLPCDVIHFDIHYMDDYRCFTWDRERFPTPRAMIDTLHTQGFKALSMIDPGIKVDPGYAVYDSGVEHDTFIKYPDGVPFTGPVWPGECHFPDFTDPDVRRWWGDLYQGLLDDGMDAFWNDMNEIALITSGPFGTRFVPDIVRHSKEGHGADHAEIHNVYGMQMARASTEGLARLRPERRPLILTRSGWAGVQRYAMHWTGDNQSTWDHLALSIPMVLNLGLSGVAMTGPDVGGFSGGPSGELYARWMQLGAFTPFFRAHSMIGSPDHEPWAFGPEVEAISRKYLELRYRLLPYLYTAVWQSAQTGQPVMRALAFSFPDDMATYSMDDQFMLGDAFLVAPVVEEGARQRCLYLPAGLWFDFWSGEQHEGPQTITVDAPLDHLPLFVRTGAVVPFWPVQQYVGEQEIDELECRVYLNDDPVTSALYEDDGLTPAYEQEALHRVSHFTVSRSDAKATIAYAVERGQYTPSYQTLKLRIKGLKAKPQAVTLEAGEPLSHTWSADTSELVITLKAQKEFVLHITL